MWRLSFNQPGGPNFTTDGKALTITVHVPAKSATQYIGTFLHFGGCVDASAFAGVQFTLSGSLSGCSLQYASADDGHTSTAGGWMIASAPPGSYPMHHSIFAARLTATPQTIKAAFNAGDIRGVPSAPMDASRLIFLQWQLVVPAARASESPPFVARGRSRLTISGSTARPAARWSSWPRRPSVATPPCRSTTGSGGPPMAMASPARRRSSRLSSRPSYGWAVTPTMPTSATCSTLPPWTSPRPTRAPSGPSHQRCRSGWPNE